MRNKEKIIDAAKAVFLRYGYKRTTMNDIAEAANMSRPAVYLAYHNKEEIFKAVIRDAALKNLEEIRQGVAGFSTLTEQLFYAFELWSVRVFDTIRNSPEAKELLLNGHKFCLPAVDEIGLMFEAELVKILRSHGSKRAAVSSAPKMAHMLRSAVRGFSETAKTSSELKKMIKLLICLIVSNSSNALEI